MRITTEDCCYMSTEQDFKFGEQITLDGELLIPMSTLEKIRKEVTELVKTYPFVNHLDTYVKEDDVLAIINKYKDKGLRNDQQI